MKFTQAALDRLKPPVPKADGSHVQKDHWDPQFPNFGLRLSSGGSRVWCVMYRRHGKVRRDTLGRPPAMSLVAARKKATAVLALVGEGKDPRTPQGQTFGDVVKKFMKEYAIGKQNNRRHADVQKTFNRYTTQWQDRAIDGIGREEVADLLSAIHDHKFKTAAGKVLGGPIMANRVLAALSTLMRWHATKTGSYATPIVPGMQPGKEKARERVLTDAEIRTIWPLLDQTKTFDAIVKVLLLTAQRRGDVAGMGRSEIDDKGVWTIPKERFKTGVANIVPLTPAAAAVIAAQPTIDKCDLVFTTNGRTSFSGFSKAKRELDAAILKANKKPLAHWTIHDIRRTGRTLMAHAGVLDEIAERCLGHTVGKMKRTYNRHDYVPEKREAFTKLGAMLTHILAGKSRDDFKPAGATENKSA